MALHKSLGAHDPFLGMKETRPRIMANEKAIARVKKAVAGSVEGEKLKAEVIRRARALDGEKLDLNGWPRPPAPDPLRVKT